jgi:ATP-dependent DNA helicase MPH1
MCYTYLQEISREKDGDGHITPGKGATSSGSRSKKLRDDPLFREVVQELESQRCRGFSVHPKMDLLKALILQHFTESFHDENSGEHSNGETRVMVFVTFREAVDEIVEALNLEKPLIRASKFVGQGTDKHGRKGLAQKEQLEVSKGPWRKIDDSLNFHSGGQEIPGWRFQRPSCNLRRRGRSGHR